jgi:hypothetical protein
MPELASQLGASKSASTLLVLFIPSHERNGGAVDQERWVGEALQTLGELFGGATAFPQGRGVWRDNAAGGKLHFDTPVVVQCYTAAELIEQHAERFREFLVRMGTEAKQGAVGLVIDRDYLEIQFTLPESSESSNG